MNETVVDLCIFLKFAMRKSYNHSIHRSDCQDGKIFEDTINLSVDLILY